MFDKQCNIQVFMRIIIFAFCNRFLAFSPKSGLVNITYYRLRLQEEFRPLSVGGKVFSCFRMLNMNLTTSSNEETNEEVTCLLQYVITVDDDCMAAEKRDQRKISSDFTTEVNFKF